MIRQIKSNMTEVYTNNGSSVLYSYKTPVAAHIGLNWYKTADYWSNTTSRHINYWLDENGHGRDLVEEKPQAWFDNLITANINMDEVD